MQPNEPTILKRRVQQIGRARRSGAGNCVLYVMSRDMRVADNHALIAAQQHATAKGLPLAVAFCLRAGVGVRAREHYEFMLDGLREVERRLGELHIPFMLLIGDAFERLQAVIHHTNPDALYFDMNPLRGPRAVASAVAALGACHVFVVDTHNIVPVWVASDKKEVAAYTLRPKLHRLIEDFLVEPPSVQQQDLSWPGPIIPMQELQAQIAEMLATIPKNGTIIAYKSGELAAHDALEHFTATKLHEYVIKRNDPSLDSQSDLSPYMHFGQLSSLRVALYLRTRSLQAGTDLQLVLSPKMPNASVGGEQESIDALLEEMIVRKELSDNFCYYEPNYDSLEASPQWAQRSLHTHEQDPREFVYSYEQFERAQTHDPAWNAAQKQLTKTGKMHGYMRMYWAKKVLEWTEKPEDALRILIRLNDHYSIDGGDPNGYVGILWAVAGVHDRPWVERDIFGVIRYMNYAGLKRKFDIETYVQRFSVLS